ncbi:MAG: hypothetical protein CMP23_17395 [Rickettsiales bacterium]|nr:hypothetical protein [Rickettsiales bacterium]
MKFRRPRDNRQVDVNGEVGETLNEGGLWRGRAAVLVRFDTDIGADIVPKDEGAEIRRKLHQDRRGAEPSRLAPSPTLGASFNVATRSRRRKSPAQLASESLLETTETPPVAVTLTEPAVEPIDEPNRADPRSLREQLNVGNTEDRQQKLPDGDDGDDFFGRFQGDGTLDEIPPLPDQDLPSQVQARRTTEELLATSTHPQAAGIPPVQDLSARSSQPPPTRAQPAVPPRAGNATPPWEAASEDPARSLIPRHIRIASSLDVSFWSRGRQHEATAQNFSREGAFLAFQGDPPIRGAIIRVEFPIGLGGESLPVRFNAEVRWHRADRPGGSLPEGFGVQILTFESPKDQGRYDEMLMMLLDLHQAESGSTDAPGYRWGAPSSS